MSHSVPHCPLAQTCPLPHPIPSPTLLNADAVRAGWQLWQGLFGFAALGPKYTPPTPQPLAQEPEWQVSAVPHPFPSGMAVNAAVLVAVWQL